MKFRTEVHIPNSDQKIKIDDKIFSIGSCFASEISKLLSRGQLQTNNNPFGTLFNPYSIQVAAERLHDCQYYTEEDIISYNDDFISLDHHTDFDSDYLHKTLQNINSSLESANSFLQKTHWVIITYGTSFIYEFLPKNKWVANCHKIPAKYFRKKLLTQQELQDSIRKTIESFNDIGKDNLQILFTISPVRHTKEGMVENTLSKSKLITAVHEVIAEYSNCHYLPIYEILLDDLRDYRFYKDDMIHPNSQAVQYIFQKFGNAYFSDDTMDFIEENFKIMQSLNHQPKDENHPRHKKFLEKINARIILQQSKVKHKIF